MAITAKVILDKLKIHYKLLILNDDTFEEKVSFKLNGISAMVLGSSIVVLLVLLVTMLIIFTPLKEYIPGYADVKLRRDITRLISKSDSLEDLQSAHDNYISNLKNVLSGRIMPEALESKDKPVLIDSISLNSERPEEDKALREVIESAEKENPGMRDENGYGLTGYDFFKPVRGKVKEKFKPTNGIYSIAISCGRAEKIKAIMDGTVIMVALDRDNRYTMMLQHENNLVSIYKDCSGIQKKVNSFVKTGDVIAVMGNAGDTPLLFELWHNGKALNPQDYINF